MKTRICLNCGEPYESDAKTELATPFCCKACREWHNIGEAERARVLKQCLVLLEPA